MAIGLPSLPCRSCGRHVGDLVAALLALGDAPAEPGERGAEGQLDVVGLQAAGPRLVHRRAQLRRGRRGQVSRGQGPLGEQLFDPSATSASMTCSMFCLVARGRRRSGWPRSAGPQRRSRVNASPSTSNTLPP